MKVSYFSGIYIYQNVNSSPLKQAFLDSKASPVANFHFFWGYTQTQKDSKFTIYTYKSHNTYTLHNKYLLIQQESHLFYHPDIHLVKEKKKHSTLLKTGIKTSFNPLFLHY